MSSPTSPCDDSSEKILYREIQTNMTHEALNLLEQNVEANYVDPENSSGWTMLHWAAYHGNERVVVALLEAGAARGCKNARLADPDDHCFSSDSLRVRSIAGGTPLHRAAQRGNFSVCWLLVLSGFSIDDVDNIGNTPLHLAVGGFENVVALFIALGADVTIRNNFRMTPLDLCTEKKCRKLLKQAVDDQVKDSSAWQRSEMHHKCTEKYNTKKKAISDIIEGSCDGEPIGELKILLNDASEFGLPCHIINKGRKRVKWLEVEGEISSGICTVQGSSPVTTSTRYDTVNVLKTLMKETETVLSKDDDGNFPQKLVQTMAKAQHTCEVANAEFCLSKAMEAVSTQGLSVHDSKNIVSLEEAKTKAESLEANTGLVNEATNLLARLISEQELQAAVEQLPSVRLPVPDMTPKEAKAYWQAEDTGQIEESEGFPLLPEGSDEYVWNESKSLQNLRTAVRRLEDAISTASSNDANDDLIQSSKDMLKKKKGEQTALEEKDAEDRERAIIVAKKAAKKLRKKKKSKKPSGK